MGINYEYQNGQLVDLKDSFPELNCLYSLVAQCSSSSTEEFPIILPAAQEPKEEGVAVTARSPRFRGSKYFFTLSYLQSGFALKGGKPVFSGGVKFFQSTVNSLDTPGRYLEVFVYLGRFIGGSGNSRAPRPTPAVSSPTA